MSDLRVIPSIEQLRQRDAMRALETRYGRAALIDALRAETAALRDRLGSGVVAAVTVGEAIEAIELGAEARLRAAMRPSLVALINATGVILHTNLGRAPLSESAIARIRQVAAGYTNLEYDIVAGRTWSPRHPRHQAARPASPAPKPPSSSTTTPPRRC